MEGLLRHTLFRGAVLLVPLAVLIFALSQIFAFGRTMSRPLADLLPQDTVAGIAAVDVVALLLVTGLCYLTGRYAGRLRGTQWGEFIDNLIVDLVPRYAVAKEVFDHRTTDGATPNMPDAVLVRFDDSAQIGLEVERSQSAVTVYLPGSPGAWSGSVVLVDPERITRLDVPAQSLVSIQRRLGRGSLGLREGATSERL